MQGTSKDLASYMARVKVLAAKEGVKTYGATTRMIRAAHNDGMPAEKCVRLLVNFADGVAERYHALPRSQAAE